MGGDLHAAKDFIDAGTKAGLPAGWILVGAVVVLVALAGLRKFLDSFSD